jgi:hypothetical protein
MSGSNGSLSVTDKPNSKCKSHMTMMTFYKLNKTPHKGVSKSCTICKDQLLHNISGPMFIDACIMPTTQVHVESVLVLIEAGKV